MNTKTSEKGLLWCDIRVTRTNFKEFVILYKSTVEELNKSGIRFIPLQEIVLLIECKKTATLIKEWFKSLIVENNEVIHSLREKAIMTKYIEKDYDQYIQEIIVDLSQRNKLDELSPEQRFSLFGYKETDNEK
jgi:hypothetical protein